MRTGMDRSMLYVRKKEEVKGWPFPTGKGGPRQTGCMMIVGFCGKLYPCFHLLEPGEYSYERGLFAFNMEEVDKFILNTYGEDAYNDYCLKKYVRRSKWNQWERREHFTQFFEEIRKVEGSYRDLFEERKAPVFIAEYHRDDSFITFHVNSMILGREIAKTNLNIRWGGKRAETLSDMNFERIFHPFAAYQEISGFFGNLAFPNKPIPAISDEDLCAAKGFNEWSFRKPPKEKKRPPLPPITRNCE
jgi:hypothetical protein